MGTGQTCRVRTGKFFSGFNTSRRDIGSRRFTDKQRTFSQLLQHGQTVLERFSLLINHKLRVRRQWIGIHGIDENRLRT